MSVCDEGWPAELFGVEILPDFCPCAIAGGGNRGGLSGPGGGIVIGCVLGLWHEWLAVHSNPRPPDSCPHAPALRAVVGNPEMVLRAERKSCSNCGSRDCFENCTCLRMCTADVMEGWTPMTRPTHDQKEA